MSQCQLCLAYIEEIKKVNERLKVKSILLNETQKRNNEEVEGLQRQIDALKSILTSKGILLNSGEEELLEVDNWLEEYQDANPQFMGDAFEREREVKS